MKVEIKKEILFETLNKNKTHECSEHISFDEYLQKNIEKIEEKEKSDDIKKTSIYAEKKIARRRIDIFDTLIDL